jgi:hypothetical protein
MFLAATASSGVRTGEILVSTFSDLPVGSIPERKQEISKWA